MEKIRFETDEGPEWFYILDETRINGVNYLLVMDSEDEDDENAQAYILKDTASEASKESVYSIVEDETELKAVSGVFEESADISLV